MNCVKINREKKINIVIHHHFNIDKILLFYVIYVHANSMSVWNYFGLYFVRLCCTNGESICMTYDQCVLREALFIH